MLLDEIKNIKSTRKDLRNFGLSVGTVFAIIGLALLWYEKSNFPYLLAPGVALIVLGLVLPKLLTPLQKVWMTFAVIMGFVMTRLILSILFFIVFTAFGITAKVIGKPLLDMKIDKSSESYWKRRDDKTQPESNPEKQF